MLGQLSCLHTNEFVKVCTSYEKLEEEKINLLKSSQQEKQEFFGELLSCLKGKK